MYRDQTCNHGAVWRQSYPLLKTEMFSNRTIDVYFIENIKYAGVKMSLLGNT